MLNIHSKVIEEHAQILSKNSSEDEVQIKGGCKMSIEEALSIALRLDPKEQEASKMEIKCKECGNFIRAELSRELAETSPDLAHHLSASALTVPVWYMMVSHLGIGPSDAKMIEEALHRDFATFEYRSVAYSRRKLANILLNGIDVVPATSIFYSGRLTKSLIYGGCPKLVMLLDETKLKPTMINLGKNPSLETIMNLSDTYPYSKTDRSGYYWMSRNGVEQTRFGPEERAYAHWIPEDARGALQGVIIVDEGLTKFRDDDAFNAHLCNLLKYDP